ncbi:hypothetical protein SEMRO_323_G117330.1 [Seminavis robusta]|uniref:Uncharacterized protein n=1 Tax=Seminavis robusta TaxID=568900 RepID=A0A9N8HD03_9STRA|nr:hypothetical protein SEMRO_323_G117330.1 [Seminavis robusta]|eukprot:Sro323_g117330.1 n/a (207) ;mRNA; r:37117-37737
MSDTSDSTDEESCGPPMPSLRGNGPPTAVVGNFLSPGSHTSDLTSSTRSRQNRGRENVTPLQTLASAASRRQVTTPLRNITNNATRTRQSRTMNEQEQQVDPPVRLTAEEEEEAFDLDCRAKATNDDSDDEGELAKDAMRELTEDELSPSWILWMKSLACYCVFHPVATRTALRLLLQRTSLSLVWHTPEWSGHQVCPSLNLGTYS